MIPQLYQSIKVKMEEMQQHNMSWIEVQFLKKAVDVLCLCRQTLMYTYVFAFYLKKNNQSIIFEVGAHSHTHTHTRLNMLAETTTQIHMLTNTFSSFHLCACCSGIRENGHSFVDDVLMMHMSFYKYKARSAISFHILI